DDSYEVEISKGAGFVSRDGVVYRIPVAVARLSRLGRSLAPTPPPSGFGALGGPGCAPASPSSGSGEIFGTAGATQLWALVPGLGPGASLTGVVGRPLAIAIRFGGRSPRISAIGPGSAVVMPDSGSTALVGSSWRRPGLAWRVSLTFPAA